MKKGGRHFKPHTISRFWLRRLCEVTLFGCGTIIMLYIWARFIPTGYQLPIGLSISDIAAAVAGIGCFISLIACLWLPKQHETSIALAIYAIAVLVAAVTTCTSGLLSSPFLVVWIIVALFSGFFGTIVTALVAALVVSQVVITSIQHDFTPQTITASLFFSLLPLVFSISLWNNRTPQHEQSQFADLKDRLSTAETMSDVVINTIDDGVLAISSAGNIELINPSAQRIIGWDKGDALGLNWKSVLKLITTDGKDVSDLDNPVAQALRMKKPTHSDKLFLLTSSQKRILVSIISSPVNKENAGIIVVFRDITREKEEERQQAEFISTASHEMRTPVASIEGYLGLALNPATASIDDKARTFITKAHESTKHLGRLFQDLLDISKAEDGRLKNDPHIIDVTEFVQELFNSLKQKALAKHLTYIFTPASTNQNEDGEKSLQPIFYANVDPDHFREVISNLIENAIKYTPSGTVTVDITGDEKQVSVSVADSGIGIPKEDIPHLFQKFYRVDNSETQEISGTGLGLYLSRRLAEAMSGNLRVESEYQKGSTFFLEIPRMNTAEAREKLNKQLSSLDQTVSTKLEMEVQQMTMPQTPSATPVSSSTPQPHIQPAQSIQTMAPTPATQMPTAPPTTHAPTIRQPDRSPTLAEIEENLRNQRNQLSVPNRK